MFDIVKPLFFICETPLHAGAGTGVGTELPIQREVHTSFPKVEASGIKGAIREVFERNFAAVKRKKTDPLLLALFGHPEQGDQNAGALGLTDGRILFFPVRSRRGVFAWVTCPAVLQRFKRDMEVSEQTQGGKIAGALKDLATQAPTAFNSVSSNSILVSENTISLEEYILQAKPDSETTKLAERLAGILNMPFFTKQVAIVSDEYFSDFVQNGTEIHTRIRIGDDVVVQDGALFTEEHLPSESIIYNLVMAHAEFKANGKSAKSIMDDFLEHLPEIIQMGGNATLGKGIVRIIPLIES